MKFRLDVSEIENPFIGTCERLRWDIRELNQVALGSHKQWPASYKYRLTRYCRDVTIQYVCPGWLRHEH